MAEQEVKRRRFNGDSDTESYPDSESGYTEELEGNTGIDEAILASIEASLAENRDPVKREAKIKAAKEIVKARAWLLMPETHPIWGPMVVTESELPEYWKIGYTDDGYTYVHDVDDEDAARRVIASDVVGAGFVADDLFKDADFVIDAINVARDKFLVILCRCPESLLCDEVFLARLQSEFDVLTTCTCVSEALDRLDKSLADMLCETAAFKVLQRAVKITEVAFDIGVVNTIARVTAFTPIDLIVDDMIRSVKGYETRKRKKCILGDKDASAVGVAAAGYGCVRDITVTLEDVGIGNGTCFYFDADFLLSVIVAQPTPKDQVQVLRYASAVLCDPERTFLCDALRCIGGARAAITAGLGHSRRFRALGFTAEPFTGDTPGAALRLGEEAILNWIAAPPAGRSSFPMHKDVPLPTARCTWTFFPDPNKEYELDAPRTMATIMSDRVTMVYGAPVEGEDYEAGISCWSLTLPDTTTMTKLEVGVGHPRVDGSQFLLPALDITAYGFTTIELLLIRGYGNGTLGLYTDGTLVHQSESPFIAGAVFPCVVVTPRRSMPPPTVTIGPPTRGKHFSVCADSTRLLVANAWDEDVTTAWFSRLFNNMTDIKAEFAVLNELSDAPVKEYGHGIVHINRAGKGAMGIYKFNHTFLYRNVDPDTEEKIEQSIATLKTLLRTGDSDIDDHLFSRNTLPLPTSLGSMRAELTDGDIRAILWTQIAVSSPLALWRQNTIEDIAHRTNTDRLALFRARWAPVTARVYSEIADELSVRRTTAHVYGYLSTIILGVQIQEPEMVESTFNRLFEDAAEFFPACLPGAAALELPPAPDLSTLRGFNYNEDFDKDTYLESRFNDCLEFESTGTHRVCRLDKPLYVETTGQRDEARIMHGENNFREIVESAERTARQARPGSMPLHHSAAVVFWDGVRSHPVLPQEDLVIRLPGRAIEFVCDIPFSHLADLRAVDAIVENLRASLVTIIDTRVVEGILIEKVGWDPVPFCQRVLELLSDNAAFSGLELVKNIRDFNNQMAESITAMDNSAALLAQYSAAFKKARDDLPVRLLITAVPRRYVYSTDISFTTFFVEFFLVATEPDFTREEARTLCTNLEGAGWLTLRAWRTAYRADKDDAMNAVCDYRVPSKLVDLLEDLGYCTVFKSDADEASRYACAHATTGLRPDQVFKLGGMFRDDVAKTAAATDLVQQLFDASLLCLGPEAILAWTPLESNASGYYYTKDGRPALDLNAHSTEYLLCSVDEHAHTMLGIVTLKHWAMHTIRESFETVDSNTDVLRDDIRPFRDAWRHLCRTGIAPTPKFVRTGLNLNRYKFLSDPLVGNTEGNCLEIKLVLATLFVSNLLTSGSDLERYMEDMSIDGVFHRTFMHLFFCVLLFQRAVMTDKFHTTTGTSLDDKWFAAEWADSEHDPELYELAKQCKDADQFFYSLQAKDEKFWGRFDEVTDQIRSLYNAFRLEMNIRSADCPPETTWRHCLQIMIDPRTHVRRAVVALIDLFGVLGKDGSISRDSPGLLRVLYDGNWDEICAMRAPSGRCTLGNIVNACILPQSPAAVLSRTVPAEMRCGFAMRCLLNAMSCRFTAETGAFARDLTGRPHTFSKVVVVQDQETTKVYLRDDTSQTLLFVKSPRGEWMYLFYERYRIPAFILQMLAQ